MGIYVVQHGIAKSPQEDPERHLTEKGRQIIEAMASYLSSRDIKIDQILHSGKIRAKETAEIFKKHLLPPRGIKEQSGLNPNDDPKQTNQLLEHEQGHLMFVGHLPNLSKLVSLLVCGKPDLEIVEVVKGGVICLNQNNDEWLLEWALTPTMILS